MNNNQTQRRKDMDLLIAALILYGYKHYSTSPNGKSKFYVYRKNGKSKGIYISYTKKRIAIYTAGNVTKKTTLPLDIPHALEIVQVYENNFQV